MMMVGFMLNLTTAVLRLTWLKYFPRPSWTVQGYVRLLSPTTSG